jgi:hypothetical protein
MPDYLFPMHDDLPLGSTESGDNWGPYIGRLQASGNFQGGSAIGAGICTRKSGAVPSTTTHLTGYIRVTATNLDEARTLLVGNPAFEAGGTVEIKGVAADRVSFCELRRLTAFCWHRGGAWPYSGWTTDAPRTPASSMPVRKYYSARRRHFPLDAPEQCCGLSLPILASRGSA